MTKKLVSFVSATRPCAARTRLFRFIDKHDASRDKIHEAVSQRSPGQKGTQKVDRVTFMLILYVKDRLIPLLAMLRTILHNL